MSRLKMNAKMEYEYLDNFKILQKAFTKHRIPKVSSVGLAVIEHNRASLYAKPRYFSRLVAVLTLSRSLSSASSSARCRTTSSFCSG